MTLPDERTRAVNEMGRAALELIPFANGESATVRVPRETLKKLIGWLRHYPTPHDMAMTGKACPSLWAQAGPGSGRGNDAERYRWLRRQHWNVSTLCVVRFPKDALKLGHDAPSLERLDQFIDAEMR
jgi:hypothetical protein